MLSALTSLTKNTRGEIATTLTVLAIIVMTAGIFAGSKLSQQDTTSDSQAQSACKQVTEVSANPSGPLAANQNFRCTATLGSSANQGSPNIACGWSHNGGWPQNGGRWENAWCSNGTCTFDIRMDNSLKSGTYELVAFDLRPECGPNHPTASRITLQSNTSNPTQQPEPTQAQQTQPTQRPTPIIRPAATPTSAPTATATPTPPYHSSCQIAINAGDPLDGVCSIPECRNHPTCVSFLKQQTTPTPISCQFPTESLCSENCITGTCFRSGSCWTCGFNTPTLSPTIPPQQPNPTTGPRVSPTIQPNVKKPTAQLSATSGRPGTKITLNASNLPANTNVGAYIIELNKDIFFTHYLSDDNGKFSETFEVPDVSQEMEFPYTIHIEIWYQYNEEFVVIATLPFTIIADAQKAPELRVVSEINARSKTIDDYVFFTQNGQSLGNSDEVYVIYYPNTGKAYQQVTIGNQEVTL